MTTWSQGNPFVGDGLPDPGELVSNANEISRKSPGPKRIDSQAKGKRAERQLAAWWRDRGFPDAARYVKTGDRFTADGGDLVLAGLGPFRLVVEVKHYDGGLTDGQIAEYGAKLVRQVRQSNGSMGILVERRDRVSDAGRWWVHLHPYDFACLVEPDAVVFGNLGNGPDQPPLACRTTVGYFAGLLIDAGLTTRTKE